MIRGQTRYVYSAVIIALDEVVRQRHRGGIGEHAVFDTIPGGWKLVIRQSTGTPGVSLFFPFKPELAVGDTIRVTLEKME